MHDSLETSEAPSDILLTSHPLRLDWFDLLNLLIRRRVELGISQAAVAAACDVREETVARWEKKVNAPAAFELFAWINNLGLQVFVQPANGSPRLSVAAPSNRVRPPSLPKRCPIVAQVLQAQSDATFLR